MSIREFVSDFVGYLGGYAPKDKERRLDMMSDGFRLMVYVGMDRRLDTMSDRFQLMRCVGLGTRSDMMSGKFQLMAQPGASVGLDLRLS